MSIRWPRVLTPTHLSQLIRSQKNPLKALEIFNEAKIRYPSYHHNGPVYATMIRILGSSRRMPEMKEVINRMKVDSCESQDSLFSYVIGIYANAGLLDEAVSLFKSLCEFNCVNLTESFNTLLDVMIKESKLETCYHLFVENSCGLEIKSRKRTLNLLMDALCRINRSDLALHIFQEMGYQWCYPDRQTYRTLMKGLCNDGRLTEATHLLYSMFWKVSQKGCGADVSIYRTLLDALCDNGEVEEAAEILEKILRKGLKAPKKTCKLLDLSQFNYRNEEGILRAKGFINEALIKGGVPSSDGFRAMVIDLYTEGRISEGDKVLEVLFRRGFRPSSSIYEAKVEALFRAGQVNEALNVVEREMIEKNCVPSVKLHNTVIKGLCSVRESDWAMRYFEKMHRQVGCVPNRETYATLVDGLCFNDKYMEASQMLETMMINSYWPEQEIFNKVISGLCAIGKPYKAVIWLEEMLSQGKIPERSVWWSLVSSVCSQSHQDRIFSLIIEKGFEN